jgi:hypothetical protein
VQGGVSIGVERVAGGWQRVKLKVNERERERERERVVNVKARK